jgi:dolichyl-phosphate-mannose-protein mannosyltransferase
METLKDLVKRFSKWEYCGLLVLVVIILSLHLSIMMQPSEPYLYDEQHYVPDARIIMQGEATERPEHPPLSKLFIVAGMYLFGDNAVGWRFFPVVFSIAGIVFFYLICRRLNLSKKVSYIATSLLAFENLSFVMGSIAMLDVFCLTFTLAAFWLYLRGSYVMSGVAVGLSALAKLNGALAILVIGLHWLLNGGWLKIWHQLRLLRRLLVRNIKRRWRLLSWFLMGRVWRRLRFLPSMLVAPISFIALMPLFDLGVFHKWLNPISRIQEMLSISGSITYDWVELETGSRPWIWVLTPEVNPIWFTPHYSVMISPTLWVFIMPLVVYIIYRAIRGGSDILFPLSWFIGTYLFWIPVSLITDRVTYLFYIYPTIGAIAIGLGMVLSRLLGSAKGRGIAAIYLLLHSVAFIIISPVSLCWSIPLCLLLYFFTFWFAALGEGLWHRGGTALPDNQVAKPAEQ